MNKAIEKINILKSIIAKKNIYKNKLEEKEALEVQKIKLEKNNDSLVARKKYYQSEKDNYLFKKNSINKWKKQTIKNTLIALIIVELSILGFPLLSKTAIELIYIIGANVVAIPMCFICGESGSYYKNKKYLKEYELSEFENKINEVTNEININRHNRCLIDDRLDEVSIILRELLYKINKMELEATSYNNNDTGINIPINSIENKDALTNYESKEKCKTFTKK